MRCDVREGGLASRANHGAPPASLCPVFHCGVRARPHQAVRRRRHEVARVHCDGPRPTRVHERRCPSQACFGRGVKRRADVVGAGADCRVRRRTVPVWPAQGAGFARHVAELRTTEIATALVRRGMTRTWTGCRHGAEPAGTMHRSNRCRSRTRHRRSKRACVPRFRSAMPWPALLTKGVRNCKL